MGLLRIDSIHPRSSLVEGDEGSVSAQVVLLLCYEMPKQWRQCTKDNYQICSCHPTFTDKKFCDQPFHEFH